MGRGPLALLLLACCLLAAVQGSKASPDDSRSAKTPPSEDDPRSQRDADAPDATATVVEGPMNGTDGVHEATFIRSSEGDDQPSAINEEGGAQA